METILTIFGERMRDRASLEELYSSGSDAETDEEREVKSARGGRESDSRGEKHRNKTAERDKEKGMERDAMNKNVVPEGLDTDSLWRQYR